jgi:hypothetical protein
MSETGYRGNIAHERIPLRVRRLDENRYRVSDAKGRSVEYRKRCDFTREALELVDGAAGKEVILEGWLNRSGRWSITGVLYGALDTKQCDRQARLLPIGAAPRCDRA